jgi:hypothetical protein
MKSRIEQITELFQRGRAERLDRLYNCGFAHGRDWASLPENKDGLRRLKELFDRGDIDDSWFESSQRDRKIKFIKFALILHPDWRKSGDWVEPTIWQSQLAEEAECNVCNPYFMRGFAAGALSVLKETQENE